MADKVLCEKSDLVAVANAVRAKNGTTNTYKVNQLASAVENIKGGSTENKLAQMVEGSITTITEEDLQGAMSIKAYAFYYCSNLMNIALPNSVMSIRNNAFDDCSSLTSITIPDSVTSIGVRAFGGCSSLTSITIPDSVTSIEIKAFQECHSLTSITIGSGIKSIGNRAFMTAASFNSTNIIMKSITPPTISTETFTEFTLNKIIVPKGTGNTYKSATNWSALASHIQEAT